MHVAYIVCAEEAPTSEDRRIEPVEDLTSFDWLRNKLVELKLESK